MRIAPSRKPCRQTQNRDGLNLHQIGAVSLFRSLTLSLKAEYGDASQTFENVMTNLANTGSLWAARQRRAW
jgi:hypothetical protein